ncbi:GNAT family N-acetyltransferase [Chitinophaga lutea]
MIRNPEQDIITPRLLLRLLDEQAMEAWRSGRPEVLQRILGAHVSGEITEYTDILDHNQQQLASDPAYYPWSSRAIVLRDTAEMVGLIRFHTRPNPVYLYPYSRHAVELGYLVFSPHRRRGYASEAVQAMMEWAGGHFGVRNFVASIAPGNLASLQLVQRLGFEQAGATEDETDGTELVFLLRNFGPPQ